MAEITIDLDNGAGPSDPSKQPDFQFVSSITTARL